MRESEEAEAKRPVVEVHQQLGNFDAPQSRHYFACSCGACGPLRLIPDIARHDGTLHELWHEQNRR